MIFYLAVVLISVLIGFIIHAFLSAPAIADRDAYIAELQHALARALLDVR